MNKVILMGRLTKDPNITYAQKDNSAIARFTLAVDRRFKADNQPSADFPSCVAFGKQAEFIEKYLHKGIKVVCVGRIQTGSYKDKEGKTVYTTDIVIEEVEFAESKNKAEQTPPSVPEKSEEFVRIGIDDELPFE